MDGSAGPADAESAAITKRLIDTGVARPSEIEGCTEAEISQVEAAAGVTLPPVYRALLRAIGKRAGHLLIGTDFQYPWLLSARQDALECLADNGNPFTLPDDAVVFLGHQGYSFLYFLAREGEDPPVYGMSEAWADFGPRRVADSLSEWLRAAMERGA
jgi:hypothetical protein